MKSLLLLKTVHVACVVGSYTLFLLRGIWSMDGSLIMRQRWVRIVPHVVDTLLLGSAIALAISIEQYPFVDAWLTAKVIALLIYIVLGTVAFRFGRSKSVRVSAWLAAQAIFVYIILVAISHQPLPYQG